MVDPAVIAVDGPVAAGKGTLARALAGRYRLAYLDTGSLYRRVGYLVLQDGGDPSDPDAALRAVGDLAARPVEDALLRTGPIGHAASQVGAIMPVREALLSFQRSFANEPPALNDGRPALGAVLDGRDIGTVVCPSAPLKLFVTASPETRARRRYEEFRAAGQDDADYDVVLADVRERDERDRTRATAPLKPAEDAHLLDTTDLDRQGALTAACALVDEVLPSLARAQGETGLTL